MKKCLGYRDTLAMINETAEAAEAYIRSIKTSEGSDYRPGAASWTSIIRADGSKTYTVEWQY